MEYVKSVSLFACGAVLGSALTYILIKGKYEKIAQEEIDSVKSVFAKKEAERKENKKEEVTVSASVTPNITYTNKIHMSQKEYEAFLEKTDIYADSQEDPEPKNEQEIKNSKEKPYVIPPEEFGDFEEYERITLKFNQNSMLLTDDCGDLVDDPDDIVGKDFFYHFGEYEDDSVYVRNDRMKCDYEILLDE